MKGFVVIVMLVGPFVLYYLLRFIAVKTVLHFMMRSRTVQPVTTGSGSPELATERPAAGELIFETIGRDDEVVLTRMQEDRWRRMQKTGTKTLAMFGVALIPGVLVLGAVAWVIATRVCCGDTRKAALLAVFWGAAMFAGAAACRVHSGRLTRSAASILTILGMGLISFVITDFRAGMAPDDPRLIILASSIAAPIVVLVFWMFLIYLLGRRVKAGSNSKLGILRVFDSDRNAAFLFKNIARKWRFAGVSVTIADAAYVRQLFSRFSLADFRQIILVIGLYFIGKNYLYKVSLMAMFGTVDLSHADPSQVTAYARFLEWLVPILGFTRRDLETSGEQIITSIDLYFLLIPLMLVAFLLIWFAFTRTPQAAIRKIAAAERARVGGACYRPVTLFCYDDVWKTAVDRMMQAASVIIMDLRGFSEKRKGSSYEIGKLIDYYPIGRTLFIVDAHTATEPIASLIRERWCNMSSDSPNACLKTASVRFYHCGSRDGQDIPQILRLLSMRVDGDPKAELVMKARQAGA